MKTKEEGWIKGSFDVKLAYEPNPKHIENGRIYRNFGLDMANKRRQLYHIPTKTIIGIYDMTLLEIKELIDRLLAVNIDWTSSDLIYFQTINKEITKEINKIITDVK